MCEILAFSNKDHTWVIYGSHMGYIRITYGLYMDHTWVTYGSHIGYIWVTHGLYTNHTWVAYGSYIGYVFEFNIFQLFLLT